MKLLLHTDIYFSNQVILHKIKFKFKLTNPLKLFALGADTTVLGSKILK